MNLQSFYTVKEAAALLRVHTNTIRNLIHAGKIEYYLVGEQIRITGEELQRLRVPAKCKNLPPGHREKDIEIISGELVKDGKILARFGSEQKWRRVYYDYKRKEVYVLYKAERYYARHFSEAKQV